MNGQEKSEMFRDTTDSSLGSNSQFEKASRHPQYLTYLFIPILPFMALIYASASQMVLLGFFLDSSLLFKSPNGADSCQSERECTWWD